MPFNYNPGVQNRSGEILAQYMNGGFQSIARGLEAYRENKAKKEQDDMAFDFIWKKKDELGLQSEDEAKQVIKLAGGGGQALHMLSAMEEAKQQKKRMEQDDLIRREMAQAQLRGLNLSNDQATQMMGDGNALNARADAMLGYSDRMQRGTAPTAGAPGGPMAIMAGGRPGPRALGGMDAMAQPGNMAGAGVLTPGMAAAADRFAGSPAGDMRRLGVRLTPDIMAEMARAQLKTKPAPGSMGYRKVEMAGVGTGVQDVATGELADAAKFHKPADKKNDEKALTATEIQSITAMQQASRDLDALESAYTEIGDKDWGGPVMGKLIPSASKNMARIENLITGATPNLARGVFREVGVLTDADQKRYQSLLPSPSDTAIVRAQKFKDLRAKLGETAKETLSTLSAAGRDVAGLQEKLVGKVASQEDGAKRPTKFKDEDGKEYPIKEIGGVRGVIKRGLFYPVTE